MLIDLIIVSFVTLVRVAGEREREREEETSVSPLYFAETYLSY